ncbi:MULTISPECIES: GNAT family N-acetyltransferase [Alphaproteobacteria]|uniref:GNAT family N-acetyltransferase n=1 Tax=Alphaproteobacteria TaxID=28211 RepID=UPI001AEDCE4A|nr:MULTISPECIES: GNAT family N-acetyltransferase [Alphaproteobacteria]
MGQVGFADHKRDLQPSLDGTPEAGWLIAPDMQGVGLATEALGAALAWADENFLQVGTACIIAPQHEVSIRVATKCGFLEQGFVTFRNEQTLLMRRNRSQT